MLNSFKVILNIFKKYNLENGEKIMRWYKKYPPKKNLI